MSSLNYRALDEHDFAVINPLQVSSSQWQDLWSVSVVPASLQSQGHLMPMLVELRAMAKDARSMLFARAEAWDSAHDEPYFSALMRTSATNPQLASHLRARFIARNPAGGTCWLRFHDPRVFQHLLWILTPGQIQGLLGPVTLWTWRDVQGRWHARSRDDRAEAKSPQLSAAQWDTLGRIGLLNRTLLRLARKYPALVMDDAFAQRVERLLAESFVRHGLKDEADRRLYVEQIIRFHPSIHQHPSLENRLAMARAGECTYVEACSDLDDDAISRAIADLSFRSTRTHA